MDFRFNEIRNSADLLSYDGQYVKEFIQELFLALGYVVLVPREESYGDVLLIQDDRKVWIAVAVIDYSQSRDSLPILHVMDAKLAYRCDCACPPAL